MVDGYQEDNADLKDRGSDILLKIANPDIFRLNSFRILELPVTASPREISSQMRKLDLVEKFGNNGFAERGALYLNPAPDTEARQTAYQRLVDPESRLIDELFWFWPLQASPVDADVALTALIQNNLLDAISIWKRNEMQNSESHVSTHNLAILYHALALDLEYTETAQSLSKKQIEQKRFYWKEAYSRWNILLNNECFWQRLKQRIDELDDPRLTSGSGYRIRSEAPSAIISINALLAAKAVQKNSNEEALFHINLINGSDFDKDVIENALRRAVEPMRDRIKVLCTNSETETNKSPEHADEVAIKLIENTSIFLNTIDTLLPNGHPTRESAHDEVASQILSSTITFGNKTSDHKRSLELANHALSISTSASIRQRIETNIEIVSNNLRYNTCWFCGQNPSEDEAVLKVNMYGDVQSQAGWTSTKYTWRKLAVAVPRCKHCKSIHGRKILIGWLGAILGIILAVVTGVNTNGWIGCAFFVGCLIIGLILAPLSKPDKVFPEKYKLTFPDIVKLISQGWGVGDKPPGVS
ncbi:MAG: hypothetical protein JXA46_15830 [Dehalococcoidales bacterium]|nr:hypothetical protein [Dehalococcoidales bacterium]